MAHKPRAIFIMSLILVLIITVMAVIPGMGAEPRFRLNKETSPSDGVVNVGEKVRITLTFENEWGGPATIRVTDPNPDEVALKIDPSSITGGAFYVAASASNRERVEWTGELNDGAKKTITFEMEALSGGAGRTVTNRATLEDVNDPQSLPVDRDKANITINTEGLPAPVLEPIENSDEDGEYTLKWSSVTGASSYTLEEADNGTFAGSTVIYSGSGTQHAVSGQLPGKWYYRVRAVDGPEFSDWSNTEWTIVVPLPPELYPIANPCNEPDYLVDWSDVAGAGSYTLQEDDEEEFQKPTSHDGISESQYQVAGQAKGTWYYRVRAESPDGSASSDWSEIQWVKVGGLLSCTARLPVTLWRWPPAPDAPTLQQIDNPDGKGDFEVRWSPATPPVNYILQEAKDNKFQPVENSYPSEEASYDVENRGASRLFYRVMARNSTGDSPWSNVEHVDVVWHLQGSGPNPENEERQTNGSVVSGFTYFGTIQDENDASDYFYVDLPGERTIEMWLSNIPSGNNWDLVLRDFGLNTYDGWYSIRSSNRDEHVEVTVPGGRYYIQVYNDGSPGSTQPYHLKVVY